jgi:alkanesulfonate monooxygenase SsuD/methylene tetrahydromethanopterin reductase-like flavin-dependent oxidoreductase (luciferase family)
MAELDIGILLPHFGDDATVARIVGHAPVLERLGYRSAWVRDNLAYTPHAFEPPGRRFVDPFVTLSAVGAVTTSLGVGTAVTIPVRPPAVTAALIGSLCWLAPGRVQIGMGFGSPRPAFAAVGVDFPDRFALCDRTLALLRDGPRSGGEAAAPSIDPAPPPDLPLWLGGGSARARGRAIRWCDGLLLARADLTTLATTRERAAAVPPDRAPLRMGTVALVLPGRSYEDALRDVDTSRLLGELARVNRRDYAEIREARGAVLAGSPDDIAAGVAELAEAGVELVVIDLRMAMSRFEEWTAALGERLLQPGPPSARIVT